MCTQPPLDYGPSCLTTDMVVCYLNQSTTVSCKLEGGPMSCSDEFHYKLSINGTSYRDSLQWRSGTELYLNYNCLEEGCINITWAIRCGSRVINNTVLLCVQGLLGPVLSPRIKQDQGDFNLSFELPRNYYGLEKWFKVQVWKDGAVCGMGNTNDTRLQIENHTCASGLVEVTVIPWNLLGMGENATLPFDFVHQTLSTSSGSSKRIIVGE